MQLSMVGIMNLEIKLLMSSNIKQVLCWCQMENFLSLSKIKDMKKFNFGIIKEKLGWNLSNQKCPCSGLVIMELILWGQCQRLCPYQWIGQQKLITYKLLLFVTGKVAKLGKNWDCRQKMNILLWDLWWRKIILTHSMAN